jgi:regulator of ribonuclease activity A
MRATTDLYDDFEDSCETCSIQFRDFGGRNAFFGRIRTVKCFHDNVLFRELLNEPGEGDVIVVDGGGSTAIALMGDMLAARARDNGWGETDTELEFGGARFRPGHWVYCDEDGVLVSPEKIE